MEWEHCNWMRFIRTMVIDLILLPCSLVSVFTLLRAPFEFVDAMKEYSDDTRVLNNL